MIIIYYSQILLVGITKYDFTIYKYYYQSVLLNKDS